MDGGASSTGDSSSGSGNLFSGLSNLGQNLLQAPSSDSQCCINIAAWGAEGCWCSAVGQELLSSLTPIPARSMLLGLGRLCRQPVSPSVSACLQQG